MDKGFIRVKVDLLKNATDDIFKKYEIDSDLKTKAVRGAGITVFSQVLTFAIHISSAMILARLLTPVDFGLVTMVTTFSLLLQNFGFNGFTEAIIQKEDLKHEHASAIFWINITFGICLTILFMLSGSLLALFYGEVKLKLITVFISFSIIASSLSTVHLALIKRNMQFFHVSLNSVIAKALSLTLAIIFAYTGYHYWALVISTVALPLSSAIGGWYLCPWKPGLPRLTSDVKIMFKFALNTYGNFTLNYFSRNIDNLLIGWRYKSQALGYYKKAYDLFAMPVNQLIAPLTSVALATLSRLKSDPTKYCRYYIDSIASIAFISTLISLILTINGKDIIIFILGPQWIKSGEIFTYFGVGIGAMLIYGTHGWLHLSLGNANRWLRWGILEILVTTLSFIIGLPFGPSGVAAAWTISFYILLIPSIWYAGKPVNLKIYNVIKSIWRYFLSAILSGLIAWYLLNKVSVIEIIFHNLNIILRIIISSAICTLVNLINIIIIFQSKKPITKIIALFYEMLPSFHKK